MSEGVHHMLDLVATREKLAADMDQLVFEIDTLWKQFQDTAFFGNSRNFPNAHYGYMMSLFARIDLLSRYWKGNNGDQTARIVAFLDKYVAPGKHDANKVAVQLWRHTAMHTAEARFLEDQRTSDIYTWRLDFGRRDGIPHYEFSPHPHNGQMVLWLVMTEFVRDLKVGQERYLDDLEKDSRLQATFTREDKEIQLQKFSL
jgi:hypothetical protein